MDAHRLSEVFELLGICLDGPNEPGRGGIVVARSLFNKLSRKWDLEENIRRTCNILIISLARLKTGPQKGN